MANETTQEKVRRNVRSAAREAREAKRLAKNLDGRYEKSPEVQSAVTMGRNQVAIGGSLYPAEGVEGQGGAVAVVNVGTPAVARYAPANRRSVVGVAGSGRGGGGDGGGGGTVYVAGEAISIDGSNAISVRRNASGAIGVVGGGLTVNVGDGMQIVANALMPKLHATQSGLQVDASGLAISLDTDPGLEVVGGKLRAKVGNGIARDTTGLILDLAPDPAIEFSSGKARVKVYHGIARDGNGVGVKRKATSGLDLDADGLAVKLKAISGLEMDATGVALADSVAGDGLDIADKVLSVKHDPSLLILLDTLGVNKAHAFTWTGNHIWDAGARFNTDPQVYANLDFVGPAPREITSTVHLSIKPTGDLTLDPTGAILLPDAQEMRTSTVSDLVTGIQGMRLWSRGGTLRQLTIGAIKADELIVRAFTADETRITRGEQYWSRSFGVVQEDFVIPAIGATVDVWLEESPALASAKLFLKDNWIMLRSIERSTGLTVQLGWFQVVDADGTGSNDYIQRQAADVIPGNPPRQQWRLIHRALGIPGTTIKTGNVLLDAGRPQVSVPGQPDYVPGQGWIHLSALASGGGPFIQIGDFTSVLDNVPQFTNRVRMGNLNGTVDYTTDTWGQVGGNNIGLTPSAGYSGYTVDATQGLRLFNTQHKLYTSGILVSEYSNSGLRFLTDSSPDGFGTRWVQWQTDLGSAGSVSGVANIGVYNQFSATRFRFLNVRTASNSALQPVIEMQAVDFVDGLGMFGELRRDMLKYSTSSTNTLLMLTNLGKFGVSSPSSSTFIPASVGHFSESSAATDATAGVTIEQGGTGDAVLQFLITGVRRWVAGIDNSDGDKFKLGHGADLALNAMLTLDWSTGYSGFGTTSPAATLDVNGSIIGRSSLTVISASAGGNPTFVSTNDLGISSLFYTGRSGNAAVSGETVIENSAANPILLNPSGGIVGIGTLAPTHQAHIKSASGVYQVKLQANSVATSAWGGIGFGVSTDDAGAVTTAIRAIRRSGATDIDLEFRTGSDDFVSLFLDASSGNAAIATNAIPSNFRFTVAGPGVTPEPSAVLTTQTAVVSVQGDGHAYFMARDVTNNIEGLLGTSTVGVVFLGAMTAHDLELRTGNTTRVTLRNANGSMGVGTGTPGESITGTYSYSTTARVIQVEGQYGRLIARGSTDAALDLIDSGTSVNLKWFQAITGDGFTYLRAMKDDSATRRDLMTFNHSSGAVGMDETNPTAALDVGVSGMVGIRAKVYGGGQYNFVGGRADGTRAAPVRVPTGSIILGIGALGYTSGGWANNTSADIYVRSTENFDTGVAGKGGASMMFWTRQNGTAAPVERVRIDHDGQIYFYNSYNSNVGATYRSLYISNGGLIGGVTSSLRYKTAIRPLNDTYDDTFMLNLRPILYKQKGDSSDQLGFIAEEVDALGASELVVRGKEGEVESLHYERFIVPTIGAVQRLISRTRALEARVAQLEGRLN
ncbi:MAG: tail fiber domain-containing protein [Caldilineaceae bacterium]|nr:tail fiber domain-containing protein [Caldilineaceae bacterium]